MATVPVDAASHAAAVRIVAQGIKGERRRRHAYWAVVAILTLLALAAVTAERIDEGRLWALGGLFAGHLVVNLWLGVKNRARLALNAGREVLDESALVEATELARTERISAETAVRDVARRRSLRAR